MREIGRVKAEGFRNSRHGRWIEVIDWWIWDILEDIVVAVVVVDGCVLLWLIWEFRVFQG